MHEILHEIHKKFYVLFIRYNTLFETVIDSLNSKPNTHFAYVLRKLNIYFD